MADTCPRDWMGFCLVAVVSFCGEQCQHQGKTLRDKLAIVERARQKRLRALASVCEANPKGDGE